MHDCNGPRKACRRKRPAVAARHRLAQFFPTLARHMLVDGFDIVVDLKKSKGSYLVDAKDGQAVSRLLHVRRVIARGVEPSQDDVAGIPGEARLRCRQQTVQLRTSTPRNRRSLSKRSRGWRCPRTCPHAFFVEGGALGVENALKAAFDWKIRKNFAQGLPRKNGDGRSSISASASTAGRATPSPSRTPIR